MPKSWSFRASIAIRTPKYILRAQDSRLMAQSVDSSVKPRPVHAIAVADIAKLAGKDRGAARVFLPLGHRGAHVGRKLVQISYRGHTRRIWRRQLGAPVP